MPPAQSPAEILDAVLPRSRALTRLLEAQPALRDETLAHLHLPLDAITLRGFLPGSLDESSLKPALRQLKHRAYARLVTRDLAGLASLAEVTEGMTQIAEIAVATAQNVLTQTLIARYGTPRNAEGQRQQMIVIGMGKLGGRELNVSSDIDLIFVYPEDGETDGVTPEGGTGKRIDNFDFFSRLGRALINAIADITGEGQVFRVDMRLRPNGDSGPLVCSFDMLENYFITQGREWERYAWIKARPMPPEDIQQSSAWTDWLATLESLRRPFVFRKYLDFGTINAMRELHAQIRREVARKEMAENVKLGPGGIREIEFIAQVFQLIRGGRDTALQCRPTLSVLSLLAERQQLGADVVAELDRAYHFLRRLEHRLQYLDDAQTHSLPEKPEDQTQVALAMGFENYAALLAELDDHRQRVAQHFEHVFSDPNKDKDTQDDLWQGVAPSTASSDALKETAAQLMARGYHDGMSLAQRLSALREGGRYQLMPDATRSRFDALAPRVIEVCARTTQPDAALTRILDLLEAVSRRPAYLSLLLQYPQALKKLAELASASLWAAHFLQRHPLLLDELLDPRILDAAPDWASFRTSLERTLEAAEPDTEQQMDILREAHHAQVFRLLVQDINGVLTVEKLADHLSALADLMLELVLKFAWRKIAKRHVEVPHFAIISYGKLGGKELGYASDLDLMFVMDDADTNSFPDAAANYARLATRLSTWLSSQTAAGILFETDLRLRPNGESGLLVVTLAGLRQYQHESAWVWEHQALTRARFSAGDARIGAAFESIRDEILRQPRDCAHLRHEVMAMRQKMLDSHATPSDQARAVFDLKHDRGGLIDVEFIVQYLVLGHAHEHPRLTGNLGNIALLGIAAELGLIPPALAEAARNAYRDYRRLQHTARLNNVPARVTPAEIAGHVQAVRALWQTVFGTDELATNAGSPAHASSGSG